MHLIIDGYEGNPTLLHDREALYQLLDTYPAAIGMTKIAPPFVFRYVGQKPDDWGFSGFVLIAESHISIHTFPTRGYVNIDIFSCKDFPVRQAIEDMSAAFGLGRLKTFVLHRGLEYPADPSSAAAIVRRERQAVAVGAQPELST
jgi:S-adenosylmethionine decarboxylase